VDAMTPPGACIVNRWPPPRFTQGDFEGLWLQLRTARVRYGQVKSKRTDQRTEADMSGVIRNGAFEPSMVEMVGVGTLGSHAL
jgi:hypothetical protein